MPNAKAEEAPVEAPEVAEPAEVEPDETPAELDESKAEEAPGRRETFEATRPDGTVVVVHRNIDTGEQSVTEK